MSSAKEPVVRRFGNGLTVLIKEDKSHPVVSLQYWVGTGSMNEGHWQGSGLSHLLEHLVFKGTENYSGQDLARKVQERGGHWNAYTSVNRTVYYIDGPAESWQIFLNLLTELVFCPTFPEEEVEREKEVVRREMAMYADDPDSVAYQLLMQTLYLKHPRRWSVLGEPASFDCLTRQDVLDYHASRYVPNNVVLSIAGDVDATEILSHLELLVEDFKARPLNRELIPHEPHQFGSRTVRKEFAVPYSKLNLAWRLPCSGHPDTPALSALSSILGGGRSARFYEKFHDRLGLVYSIEVHSNQSESDEGAFTISMDVDRAQRDKVRDLVLQELRNLAEEDFTEDLKRVCKQTRVSRLRRRSSAAGVASEMGADWFGARNLNLSSEWQEAIERVTTEDLHRVCSTWLSAPNVTEVSLDPLGSNAVEEGGASPGAEAVMSEHVLGNGMKVVIREDHRLPLAYACLAFKGGCRAENEHDAGVTDLMSECLLKGTATRSAADIARFLEDIGGAINTSTGNNSLSVGCQILAEDLDAGLELMADVVMNPSFPEDAFLREKESFVADAEEDQEDPLSVAFRQERRVAYGHVSYGNAPSGTPESLSSLTVQDVRDQYERIICASNAVICISGDVRKEEVLPLLEKHLGGMRAGTPPVLTPTPALQAGREVAVLDKQQAVLVVGMPGVDVASPEMAQALLFQSWCSDMAGPVFTSIREEAGLAYYASSSLFIGMDAGGICFYLGTSPEQLEEAGQRLEETLKMIYERGMTEEELERTKASALSSRLLAMQSNGTLCQMLALDILFGLPLDGFEQQTVAIRNMTLDQVNAFIKKTLDPTQPRSWSIVRPPLP
ncbi:pitrilysin family protein [Akkermansia sp.]|uniref:M16 family metallopeptidase n=1 Tax=Akkermansia sp. TaxID=1872421 RepID=UPI0025C08961|nr:pitrilysin family protein [Akkermansia sp.]MCC8148426.1 insulinase family protein [Akkermansia sp.]